MKTVTTVQENAGDIYADAQQINEDRKAAEEPFEDEAAEGETSLKRLKKLKRQQRKLLSNFVIPSNRWGLPFCDSPSQSLLFLWKNSAKYFGESFTKISKSV